MNISWKNYLSHHASRKDLETNSREIQKRFSDSTISVNEKSNVLSENKALVALTCNSIAKEVQATFHHHHLKESFSSSNPDHIGLMGFGASANAVRIGPSAFFATSSKAAQVPSMDEFMILEDDAEFKVLTADNLAVTKTRNRFAVLLPFLAEIMFEAEHFDAAALAIKFIEKIKERHFDERNESTETEAEEELEEAKKPKTDGDKDVEGEESNKSQEDDREEEKQEALEELLQSQRDLTLVIELEENYYDILIFLWSVSRGLRSHPGLPLSFCSKRHTITYVSEMRMQCLLKNLPQSIPTNQNIPPGLPPPPTIGNVTTIQPSRDLKDLTGEFKNLAKAMNARNLSDLKEKQEIRSHKTTKRFEKMSTIKKNTIVMFQVGPHHDQMDVEVMNPTDNMLIAINQSTSADVVSLLRSHGARKGIIEVYESGFGAAIRDSNLASAPRPMDVNNMIIFLIHPGAKIQVISARDTLLYQMKAELGKLEHADVETLTSMKTFVPFDFEHFLHVLKGMEFVCEFLGGQDCYSAMAGKHAREHAETNEFLYVDKASENPIFYASVSNGYHRRHHTFLHSLEFRKVDKMATGHMEFTSVTDKIDQFEYVVHRPTFIPRKRLQESEANKNKHPRKGNG